jgi:DNA-binding PadR family transcriptional regulator
MHDLTAFQRDQLYVIAGLDGARGVRIQDELEKYYMDDVQPGRLYPNLDKLVEKGLVNKEPINDRANSYSPTRRALRTLDARDEWEAQYVRRTEDEPGVASASMDD